MNKMTKVIPFWKMFDSHSVEFARGLNDNCNNEFDGVSAAHPVDIKMCGYVNLLYFVQRYTVNYYNFSSFFF